jgi:RNA polymerase sigma-70 factor (ECF subfamily)
LNPNAPTRNDDHGGDLQLVREALSGRTAAIDRLSDRLRCVPSILNARNMQLGSPLNDDELTDLSQDTLTTVLKKLESFEGRSSLETWVYSFCMHQMMNGLRSKRRRPQNAGDDALEIQAVESGAERGDALEYEYIYVCLERLDQAQAAIIKLKHFSALTFEEIASRLTMSPNSVKTLYYRGLARLRALLKPHLRGEFA